MKTGLMTIVCIQVNLDPYSASLYLVPDLGRDQVNILYR